MTTSMSTPLSIELSSTRGQVTVSVLTDVRVDGGLVEGLNERLLRRPGGRVQLEVASNEELTGHRISLVRESER